MPIPAFRDDILWVSQRNCVSILHACDLVLKYACLSTLCTLLSIFIGTPYLERFHNAVSKGPKALHDTTGILLLIPFEDCSIHLKGFGHVDAICYWLQGTRNRQLGSRYGYKTHLLIF